jgi:FkbM family methyltransferase
MSPNRFLDEISAQRQDLMSPEDDRLIWELRKSRGINSNEIVEISVRPLDDARVFLRSGSSDPIVVYETFLNLYHVPPSDVGEVRSVLDLGCNIGLTLAHYAVLFPNARLLGVELDPGSASIARLNVFGWKNRCKIITGAAWVRNEPVEFGSNTGEEYGSRIGGKGMKQSSPGYSIDAFIEMLDVQEVDFLKMDIEGAEIQLLTENILEWPKKVKTMLIELHGYSPEKLVSDLDAIGFAVRKHTRHWESFFAIRKDLITR